MIQKNLVLRFDHLPSSTAQIFLHAIEKKSFASVNDIVGVSSSLIQYEWDFFFSKKNGRFLVSGKVTDYDCNQNRQSQHLISI